MITLKTRTSYYQRMIRLSIIMLVSFTIILLLDISSILLVTCFFAIIMMVVLGRSYFEYITVSDSKFRIRRRNLFKASEFVLDTSTIDFELKKTASYKGGRFYILEIRSKKQLKFTIDSRDGFRDDELVSFFNEVSKLKNFTN